MMNEHLQDNEGAKNYMVPATYASILPPSGKADLPGFARQANMGKI